MACGLLSVACRAGLAAPITWIENGACLRQIGAVRRALLLSILCSTALWAGCHQPAESGTATKPPAANPYPGLPTHAQPRLQTMKLYLGPEMLEAELALTPLQVETGMMFRTNIQDTDAMLFDLQVPQRARFWMMNCPESISVAYITSDGVIQEIHHLEKNDTNEVVAGRDDIVFALETSEGWFTRHHIGAGTVIESEKGPLAKVFLQR